MKVVDENKTKPNKTAPNKVVKFLFNFFKGVKIIVPPTLIAIGILAAAGVIIYLIGTFPIIVIPIILIGLFITICWGVGSGNIPI